MVKFLWIVLFIYSLPVWAQNIHTGGGTYLTLNSNTQVSINDLLIANNGSLELKTNSLIILSGNVSNEGTFISQPGSMTGFYYSGSNSKSITGKVSLSKLVVSGGGDLVVNDTISISDSLILKNGIIKNFPVRLTGSFGEGNNESYVQKIILPAFENSILKFPTGSNNVYLPVIVTVDSIYGAGNLTCTYFDAGETPFPTTVGSNSVLNHYFRLESEEIDFLRGDLTASYMEAELNPLNILENNLKLFRWNGSGWNQITIYPEDYDTLGNKITIRNSTLLSDYIFSGSSNSPLPVEMTDFHVTWLDQTLVMVWKTKTESNNFGFDIEISMDKVTFRKIGFVDGMGSTLIPQNYQFSYKMPDPKQALYIRLKQIDFDGQFKYSEILEVKNEGIIEFNLSQNYPNPFNPSTLIKYSIESDDFVSLKIYDILGKEIRSLVNEKKTRGFHETVFMNDNLPSGVYFYKLKSGKKTVSRQMLLLK
ncbi:MAG: T9SS type A sorting domain-containing protein [Bacteroidetes bacterium]|nr:T9SS type A sorting domain-containing protein [Bacteroidota bacterium]